MQSSNMQSHHVYNTVHNIDPTRLDTQHSSHNSRVDHSTHCMGMGTAWGVGFRNPELCRVGLGMLCAAVVWWTSWRVQGRVGRVESSCEGCECERCVVR